MHRLTVLVGSALLSFAAQTPASAMDICDALEADAEIPAEVAGFVDSVTDDLDDPYLFLTNTDGQCLMLVFVTDGTGLESCKEGMAATAEGILRWDEEAMIEEDLDQNLLDRASVVCEEPESR